MDVDVLFSQHLVSSSHCSNGLADGLVGWPVRRKQSPNSGLEPDILPTSHVDEIICNGQVHALSDVNYSSCISSAR